MKYAILLVAATMGSCMPQSSPGQKLPFKPAPKKSGLFCPTKGYDEDRCGTKRYCQAIDIFGASSDRFNPKPLWDTTEACFNAREQEPKQKEKLPFDFGFSSDSDCANRGMTVKSCGTKTYCEAIDKWGSEEGNLQDDIRWSSTKECLDAHVPEPKNLPWKQRGDTSFCGDRGDFSEDNCGTEAFCDLFENEREVFLSPYVWTKEQCLAAHKPNPGAMTFPDN
ncbi:hypothetical protein MAJ_10514, partial [Metarhizium majus ARSEF 297]